MDGIGWLGLFVAALGIGMVLWGLTQRSKANALVGEAQSWPTVPGTITATQIVQGGTNRNPTFAPMVRYEFEVDGGKHLGERLRPGYVKVGSRGTAERMLEPFPVGASVPVRYDPADPGSSLLELKTSSIPMVTAIFGVVLLLMGGAIVVTAMQGLYSRDSRPSGPATSGQDFVASSASTTSAQPAEADARTWRGFYSCAQGDTGLEVTLRRLGQGRLEGTLSFFPLPANPGVPRGCYRVTGQADATGGIEIRGGPWVRQPPGYYAVDLTGRVGEDGSLSGRVIADACSQFQLQPVAAPAETCS
jgi:Protein of unknown function (DUF3592)